MDTKKIEALLKHVKDGSLSIEEAIDRLKHLPFEEISVAKIDHHRQIRTSLPEVIFAPNKSTEDVVRIARLMLQRNGRFLITRATEEIYKRLNLSEAKYFPESGIIFFGAEEQKKGKVLVVSAGTSDMPVAQEAQLTASYLGSHVEILCDVGVAGIHRVLNYLHLFGDSKVIVVVAGMEGALPSVIGGLTDKPIIAVPTSVGYGANLNGFAALLTMLNSCVPGIAVVNIDNGFGAGCLAHKINLLSCQG
ncbi:MAG: nickel pincer cofactor biosynthesis protein LarB [Thermodesulfovibrionales bacterium]|nr:nickel pincer cofactor biosynthesis protein LarB [Thermodesulfovibrionales bacterium]